MHDHEPASVEPSTIRPSYSTHSRRLGYKYLRRLFDFGAKVFWLYKGG